VGLIELVVTVSALSLPSQCIHLWRPRGGVGDPFVAIGDRLLIPGRLD